MFIKIHKRHAEILFSTKCDIDPVTLEQVSLEQGMRTEVQLGYIYRANQFWKRECICWQLEYAISNVLYQTGGHFYRVLNFLHMTSAAKWMCRR